MYDALLAINHAENLESKRPRRGLAATACLTLTHDSGNYAKEEHFTRPNYSHTKITLRNHPLMASVTHASGTSVEYSHNIEFKNGVKFDLKTVRGKLRQKGFTLLKANSTSEHKVYNILRTGTRTVGRLVTNAKTDNALTLHFNPESLQVLSGFTP